MNVCEQCPLRLFNDRGHNISGIGNIWSGNALVLPNVDTPAYKKQDMSFSSQVEILNTILPTGGLESNLYVMPLIRCNEHFDIEITDKILTRCYHYFEDDINSHQVKNIMLCGDAARRMLNVDDIVFDKNGVPYTDCEEVNRRLYVACSRCRNKLYLKFSK